MSSRENATLRCCSFRLRHIPQALSVVFYYLHFLTPLQHLEWEREKLLGFLPEARFGSTYLDGVFSLIFFSVTPTFLSCTHFHQLCWDDVTGGTCWWAGELWSIRCATTRPSRHPVETLNQYQMAPPQPRDPEAGVSPVKSANAHVCTRHELKSNWARSFQILSALRGDFNDRRAEGDSKRIYFFKA